MSKDEQLSQEQITQRCAQNMAAIAPRIASEFEVWAKTNDINDALCVALERDGKHTIAVEWIHRTEIAAKLSHLKLSPAAVVVICEQVDAADPPKRVLYLWRSAQGETIVNVFSNTGGTKASLGGN